MPGNIWLILIAAIAVSGNGLRPCGGEVQAKCASTYMTACLGSTEIQGRMRQSAWNI
jgi:hypothetical protein